MRTTLTYFLLALALALFVFVLPSPDKADSSAPTLDSQEGGESLREASLLKPSTDSSVQPTLREAWEPSGTPDVRSIRITDSVHAPVSDAKVLRWTGDTSLATLTTDDHGSVTFPSAGGFDGIAVLADGHYPVFFACHSTLVDQQFQLPVGLALSGRVMFLGQRDSGIKSLSLSFSKPQPHIPVPRTVLERMEMNTRALALNDDGYFGMSGLPVDWRGALRVPNDWIPCSYQGPGAFDLKGVLRDLPPTEGLRLELMQMPGLIGRVVTPDGESGVGGVRIGASIEFSTGQREAWFYGAKSRADGSFRIPFFAQGADELEAWCRGEEVPIPRHVEISMKEMQEFAGDSMEFDLSTFPDPWNLGDLPLRSARILEIHVQDAGGSPIEGAFAEGDSVSEVSEAAGVVRLRMAESDHAFKVFAPGKVPLSMEWTQDMGLTMVVVLTNASGLRCQLRIPEGISLAGLTLHFTGAEGLFEEPLQHMDLFRHRQKFDLPQMQGGLRSDGVTHLERVLQKNESVILQWGFRPGVPIRCRVEGQMGNVLATSEDLVLQPGETMEIEFDMESILGRIHGTVEDERGDPIERASIQLFSSEGHAFQSTDAGGSFAMDGLPLVPMRMIVAHPDFAHYTEQDLLPTADGQPMRIRMEDPRAVDVFFVDPDGQYVQGGLIAFTGGYTDRSAGDAQRITKVPHSGFPLRWRIGGLDGISQIPPDVTEFHVPVPHFGSVRIAMSRASAEDFASCFLMMEPEDGTAPDGYQPRFNFFLHPGVTFRKVDFDARVAGKFHAWVEYGDSNPPLRHDFGLVEILPGERLDLEATLLD